MQKVKFNVMRSIVYFRKKRKTIGWSAGIGSGDAIEMRADDVGR
jgi:hypothetical protein